MAVAADPASVPATAEGTARKVKVTATISGKPEGDEVEVEVTLSVKCGTDDYAVKAEDSKKNIKGDGSASWDLEGLPDVETGTDSANITCTLTAKAESFDDATGTFTLAKEAPAAPGGGTAFILKFAGITDVASDATDDSWPNNGQIEVIAEGTGTLTSAVTVTLEWKCFADVQDPVSDANFSSPMAIRPTDTAVTFAIDAASKKTGMVAFPEPDWTENEHCYLRATAKVGSGDPREDVSAHVYVQKGS